VEEESYPHVLTSDLAEELVRKGYAMSYEWTQDMSLWVKVPAHFEGDKYSCDEVAEENVGG
jgi:hypothetical protein